jgi:hypothetical protein
MRIELGYKACNDVCQISWKGKAKTINEFFEKSLK